MTNRPKPVDADASAPPSQSSSATTTPRSGSRYFMQTFQYEHVLRTERWSYLADEHIKTGYSLPRSPVDIVLGLFHLHNETLNVWLHLAGGIVFLFLLVSWVGHDSVGAGSITTAARDGVCAAHDDACAADGGLGATLYPREAVKVWFNSLQESHGEGYVHSLYEKAVENLQGVEQSIEATTHELYTKAIHNFEATTHTLKDKERELVEFVEGVSETFGKRAATLPVINEMRRIAQEVEFSLYESDASVAVPRWPLVVYCLGGTVMLLASALYHLGAGYNQWTFDTLCRLDLAGISFMIAGSSVPVIYYIFYCDVVLVSVYNTLLGSSCGATLFFCVLPSKTMHKVRVLRVLSYISAGAVAIVPFVHAYIKFGSLNDGVDYVRLFTKDYLLVFSLGCYLVGAFFYVQRIPERFYPNTFDIFLSSHQIWHLLVALAALTHYVVAVHLYEWRKMNATCPAE